MKRGAGMANKRIRAINREEFEKIIETIRTGFILPNGECVRPNVRIAAALILEANLGLRIGDIVRLRLADILFESGRYHLNIIEQKTEKLRTFTVPADIFIYLQRYAIQNGLKDTQRLFPITVRAVQMHLQKVCQYLNLTGVGTHSFRKFFAVSIYTENDFNVELVRTLLQHSSVAVTQHYLSVEPKLVEQALQKHIVLPT